MVVRARPEERFAEEVLRRILGIEVTHRDDGTAHRMVDALFRSPGALDGALEVTTIGEPGVLEREAIAAKTDWRVGARRGRGLSMLALVS